MAFISPSVIPPHAAVNDMKNGVPLLFAREEEEFQKKIIGYSDNGIDAIVRMEGVCRSIRLATNRILSG